MNQKILSEGQPCRHCGTPVVRKDRDRIPEETEGRCFYFLWWFRCPNKKCRAIYYVEAAKRFFPNARQFTNLDGQMRDAIERDDTTPSPSPEAVLAASTANGGWTRKQLGEWGVPWPPPRGWKRGLERRWTKATTTKEPTPCMAKNPSDPKITCCLKLGHRGPCSWSWMRHLTEPTKLTTTAGAGLPRKGEAMKKAKSKKRAAKKRLTPTKATRFITEHLKDTYTEEQAQELRLAKAQEIIDWALERGYLARVGNGAVTDKMTVKIGDNRERVLERTPQNIAMLEAVHHFDSKGRMTAREVAEHASASRHEVKVTEQMAADFLKMMFEPQSLEESQQMLDELTRRADELTQPKGAA